jgi:hypothetical protein
MSIFEEMYKETVADLRAKGLGGIVEIVEHYNHKNGCVSSPRQHLTPYDTTYTDLKTKNENPAGFYLLPAGSPSNYDDEITLILNKSPGLTPMQLRIVLQKMHPKDEKIKHKVSESLRRLKQINLVDYDQYFKFYPVSDKVSV